MGQSDSSVLSLWHFAIIGHTGLMACRPKQCTAASHALQVLLQVLQKHMRILFLVR